MKKQNQFILRLSIIIVGAGIALFITPFFGIKQLSLQALFHSTEFQHIFFIIRIPRTLAAFIAGGGLAISGMVYQALFRNPLASPYTLGVSGGASLGAALCIAFGATGSLFGVSLISVGSFAGAVGAVLFVYSFAWSKGNNSITLLLAGVVVATVCSGLIMFVHYVTPLRHSFQIMRWIMGGVDGTSYTYFLIMAIPVGIYLLCVAFLLPQLDHFLTGDSLAHTRGINVARSRNIFIIITACAIGAIVSVCGPIGFVGIMAPHACRMLFPGTRHRLLALCSFLLGGTFLTFSDTISRTIAPPAEVPVGIITALVGGPFFLFILYRRKGEFHL